MSDKTILRIMIGIIAFVVLFFIISSIIKSINKGKNNVVYYDEIVQKKVEAINDGEVSGKYSSTDYTPEYLNLNQEGRNDVDATIDYILGLIQNKDIESLDKMLSSKYRYARFRKEGSLKKYIEEKYGGDKTLIVKDFVVVYGRLTFNIYTSEGYYVDTIKCDNYRNKDNRNIYFGDYDYEEKIGFAFSSNSKVHISCQTSFKYKDGDSIIFYIYNYESSKATIDFSGTKLYTTNNKDEGFNIISNPKIEVEPGTYEQFELKFEPVDGRLQRIGMKVSVNGKVVESDSIISYKSDDDDE
ncbi:MAG: hypothetical protein IKI57_05670 [Clostridia bacterium]|nr:hypothetical protein [Clostridia bacterium]